MSVRAHEQIRHGELGFYEAAEAQFVQGTRRPAVHPRPLFQVIRRRQVPPALADAVFAAAANEMVEPIRTAEGYALIRVLSLTHARLDEPTRVAVEEMLFAEWLADRRKAATIEWGWGNARQTTQAPTSSDCLRKLP